MDTYRVVKVMCLEYSMGLLVAKVNKLTIRQRKLLGLLIGCQFNKSRALNLEDKYILPPVINVLPISIKYTSHIFKKCGEH